MRDISKHVERRFVGYLLLVTLVLPRVVFAGTLADNLVVLLAWSSLGLVFARGSSERIPRAIVWRSRRLT